MSVVDFAVYCPVYSMTGFATVQGATPQQAAFTLTLKGVNHRFLDLALRLPPACEELEVAIRRLVKAAVRRGHVDVTLQVARGGEGIAAGASIQVNHELLAAHVSAFREAAARYGVTAEPDLNAMLRLPGVMRVVASAAPEDPAAFQAEVLALLPELLARFNEARALEGASLAKELRAAMLRLAALAAEVTGLRGEVCATYVERLRGRMTELLAGAGIGEERLLAEAALLAERSDIDEELVRLETHVARFLALLDEGGELGKRLDFLLQELNREANTVLSKTSGAAAGNGLRITELGLEMKLEIERAREQVQNLE